MMFDARYFKQRRLLNFVLYPISLLFKLGVMLRRLAYRLGVFKSVKVSCPVIVVGNITVGGTGKTSAVCEIATHLKHRGYRPGIISRGYGAAQSAIQPVEVDETTPIEQCGDEAKLLQIKTQCPVVICADRVRAAESLLAAHPVDVILSDDGLQHYRLDRDMEILMLDGTDPFGNGWCLPAGPLREPKCRLNTASVILAKHQPYAHSSVMHYRLEGFKRLNDNTEIAVDDLKGAIRVITAIAKPDAFFEAVKSLGLTFETSVFPDHHRYCASDLSFEDNPWLIMTEKDAVKCKSFATDKLLVAPLKADVDPIVLAACEAILAHSS